METNAQRSNNLIQWKPFQSSHKESINLGSKLNTRRYKSVSFVRSPCTYVSKRDITLLCPLLLAHTRTYYSTVQNYRFTSCLTHCQSVFIFIKKSSNIFFDISMNFNNILHLMISSSRLDVNFMKIYYRKCQISIFLENFNNSKNN